jgi:hypothetical protein
MEEELISLKTAQLAKEKGFDMKSGFGFCIENNKVEETLYCYTEEEKHLYIARPTQGLLQRWLREVHNIDVLPSKPNGHYSEDYILKIYVNNTLKFVGHSKTYEDVFEIGLLKALKLIK